MQSKKYSKSKIFKMKYGLSTGNEALEPSYIVSLRERS
jgi:hypothetical protein